jgi:mRNA interferase MazF
MGIPIRPTYGDVWLIDLNPVQGHEQGGTRPGVVISSDLLNHGPAELVIVAPMTRTDRGVRWHVRLQPPDTRPDLTSVVLCDALRSVSLSRFRTHLGHLSPAALAQIQRRLYILLNLPRLR